MISPLLKAFRVAAVFNREKNLKHLSKVNINDEMLLKTSIKIIIIEIIFRILYTISYEINDGTQTNNNDDKLRVEKTCSVSEISRYIGIANFAFYFGILVILTYYSYHTKMCVFFCFFFFS